MLALMLFVLLVLANGMPVVAHKMFDRRWSAPVDGGRLWRDQRPLFGHSKTWRGLITGVAFCALFSVLVNLGLVFGVLFGALALAGDLLSSFIKRRRGLPPSARVRGLDQIPEALFPMLLAKFWLDVGWGMVLIIVIVFVIANIASSPLLHRIGVRRHPH